MSQNDNRTPFEKRIDEVSSLANIIDVVMPIGRVCRTCGAKVMGSCCESRPDYDQGRGR